MKQQFYGPKGLTSTSANHIANLAKELVRNIQEEINNISFTEEITEANGHKYKTKMASSFTLDSINAKLKRICYATQLIAWLREALKDKEASQKEIPSFEEWGGDRIPNKPLPLHVLTKEEIISTWDENKYNAYLTAQTNCAVLGEYIHPENPYAEARKKLVNFINNPVDVINTGRDLTVTTHVPKFSIDDVDKKFFELQTAHREWQARFNQYQYEIDSAIENSQIESNDTYAKEYREYQHELVAIRAEYQDYVDKEKKRLKDLKIIIPKDLMPIYNEVQGLGK